MSTNSVTYSLGAAEDLGQLYPAAKYARIQPALNDLGDVIRHYTENSLVADGLVDTEVTVSLVGGSYEVELSGPTATATLRAFGTRHTELFSADAAGKAVTAMLMMKALGVWNPMASYPVNANPDDGDSKWHLCPPLGLNVIGQRGVLMMHYPPWAVVQEGTFLKCMTMARWNAVLLAAGVPQQEASRYRTIVDVNPIAAPGSGESEYPHDYFPIMMAAGFFDRAPDCDYIRSMLELYLNPPGHTHSKYTLPLLICGSPLYDPQAPGWFRTAYKDALPTDKVGSPTVNVLQGGTFRVRPDSPRLTPYLIANHMIAAGVTGKCTDDRSKMPDIWLYEAQDLVAASFLHGCTTQPDLEPSEVLRAAKKRWFGNEDASGAPTPADGDDRRTICALAQMDLFFAPTPAPPHAKYSFEEAWQRCAEHDDAPCCGEIKPNAHKFA